MIEDGYNDINAMRRKILKLKRELTQLREDLAQAKMQATEHQAKYVTMHGRHQELWRENLQLREDRRVLGAEVKRTRSEMIRLGILEKREGRWHILRDDCDGSFWYPFQQADATDASGALGRAT